MLLRQIIENRMGDGGDAARLPTWLKLDRTPTKSWMARRLAGHRFFPIGTMRFRSAETRSDWAARSGGSQRVVVRARRITLRLDGAGRASSLARHLAYIGRNDARAEGTAALFDQHGPVERPRDATRSWSVDRHYFRLIISPDNGDRIDDLGDYVRDLMSRVGIDLGAEDLAWIGSCHHNTAHPHAHVVVRGRRSDGQDLIMPRAYLTWGLRERAEETARERLGGLSRTGSERAIWRATRADAFTSLDRRLVDLAKDGLVADAAGGRDVWSALVRTRLAHLEAIGMAQREGRSFRLAPDLGGRLHNLWARLGDVRAMNQRRIEAAVVTRPLGRGPLEGRTTFTGAVDPGGAHRFVFVRDPLGVERYARLHADTPTVAPGRSVRLEGETACARVLVIGRAASLGEELCL